MFFPSYPPVQGQAQVSYGVLAWDYCVVNGDLGAGLFSEREDLYVRIFFVYFKAPFLEPLFHGVETSLESG